MPLHLKKEKKKPYKLTHIKMQDICKIEQATSPSSSSLSSPITPKTLIDLKQIIIKLLFQGQESAQILRSFLNQRLGLKDEDHVSQVDVDHHSLVTLSSLENALSILQSYDFDQEDAIRSKRKLDRTDISESLDHCKAENPCTGIVSKERRGCYKRRKNGPTRAIEAMELVDDGHAWRKYGQKDILNTKYPRNYYRCTHKFDQECQALKQVQQISENPTKYKIIYNGEHTCKNLNKTSSIITDPEDNSSILLSFETQNYPTVKNNNGLNSSSFFPSPIFHNNNHQAMVKQEHNSINQELPISPSGPHDPDHHHHHHISGAHSTLQYSSCSDNLPSSSDLTTSTPVSDQADSYDYDLDEELMMINLCMDYDPHLHLDDIMKFSNSN